MIFLTDLADQLRRRGLTVVEVPGWKTRGYAGYGFYGVRGVLHHHTATGRLAFNTSNMPTLNLLTNGRSDLAGPLCNLGFGRDGTVYVIAAGWANHAGPGAAPGVPRDQGNGWLIGIEAESSGVPPYDWTADMLRVWPHLGAALEAAYLMALPADMRLQLGHKEYSSQGKIDPAGINMDTLRGSINKVLAGGTTTTPQSAARPIVKEWSDMATEKQIEDAAARGALRALKQREDKLGAKKGTGKTSVLTEAQWTASNVQRVVDAVERVEKLLTVVAGAVAPGRIALAVWGYKGGTARTEGDVALDAYATLNGVHRQVHANEPGGSTVAGTDESEAGR